MEEIMKNYIQQNFKDDNIIPTRCCYTAHFVLNILTKDHMHGVDYSNMDTINDGLYEISIEHFPAVHDHVCIIYKLEKDIICINLILIYYGLKEKLLILIFL